ncbi:MAG: hypothetical protein J0I40_05025 [Cellulomonas sp.]|uniref:hypothetical protein n=1 Tax=Cellulomonas sp. 73-92 TaxID=1895740 RepID=UPI0009293AF2|nr:hypothetical protein [Cellulomonas sp. 73-92]MBN9374748.1 hypothetical protein [Cellulomonas sp.]OJV82938.1 MAG: hypothetical protein BGO37_13270 [Cellulomonas sp. 73-92]
MAVLVVVALALLAAAAVALLATVEAPRREGERPVRAFRRGLRAWLRPDAELRAEARSLAAVQPVDVSLEQMLRANVEPGGGYLEPGELAGSLHAAAVRVLPGHGHDAEG